MANWFIAPAPANPKSDTLAMISADDDFKAVLDACVLYPQTLRDLLLRLALAGFYAARFSEHILEEVRSNLVSDGRATEPNATRMVQLIRQNAEEWKNASWDFRRLCHSSCDCRIQTTSTSSRQQCRPEPRKF